MVGSTLGTSYTSWDLTFHINSVRQEIIIDEKTER